MTTKSLLLASVGYLVTGLVAGGLLANAGASAGKPEPMQEAAATAMVLPVSNAAAKQDRLTASFRVASAEPEITASLPPAVAAEAFADDHLDRPATPGLGIVAVSPPAPQPQAKSLAKRKPSFALLSDEQIAGVKERMRLTPFQEEHWPAIEAALKKVAARLQRDHKDGPPSIDPNSPEVQELENAAFPLLLTLSEDQKREVRTLARGIGLEAVASAI